MNTYDSIKKYKRINRNFRKLDTDKMELFIIKDSGTHDISKYYCVELNGKVLMHGFTRLSDAKRYVEDNFEKWSLTL